MAKSEKQETKTDEDIIRIAKERFKTATEAESEIRLLALEDLEFRAGRQWPDEIINQRKIDNRPCLVINRVPQFIRQITNDQRQNRPSIKVSPVDDKADIETAKIFQGLIRHIEYNSNADVAYDTAFESAVTTSFGFYRVVTDYLDHMSFNQEILIKRIRNQFSTYLDPFSKEPDGSDANWGLTFEDVQKDDYTSEHPDSELASSGDWEAVGAQAPGWVNGKSCRVAEYFTREFQKETLYLLNNDDTVLKKDFDAYLLKAAEENPEFQIQIVKERKTMVPIIYWYKINGIEVLEKTIWPGKWIPIIPVYGDELDIDGKLIREGIVRHAKDSQRMYNYWASTETETITLAPKAPYIGAAGQFKGREAIWQTANTKNHAFLEYEVVSSAGQIVGPPQRNAFEPAVQAITNARALASEDLKATTGIYDAALGNQGNEKSGIAIQRRTAQSQTSNFHYIDNLTRSLRHCGRIIVDLIPKIYDTARVARIIGEDGSHEIVKVNQPFMEAGTARIYDLSVGKYDVIVETGPSFATKRQEAVASMIDLTRAYPLVAQVAADLMVKNMDWPGAQEIAERLRKTLPPGIADDKEKKPIPPEVQAQMQQMGELIDGLTAKLNESTEVIKNKQIEIESKERIEFAKMEVDLKKELLKQQGEAAMLTFQQEINEINQRLGLLNIDKPIDSEFNESGPEQAVIPNEQQQPTGGYSPGPIMGG